MTTNVQSYTAVHMLLPRTYSM